MSTKEIPRTDSIQELAQFWDSHDLTDFADELEAVPESVFERETVVTIHLTSEEAENCKSESQDQRELTRPICD